MAWKWLRNKCFNGFARLPGRTGGGPRQDGGIGAEVGIVAVAATGRNCRPATAFKGMDQAKMREAGGGAARPQAGSAFVAGQGRHLGRDAQGAWRDNR